MMIIDAQVHAYERNHPGRPWVGTLTGPVEVTGDDMVAAMDAVGVAGALLVSPLSLVRLRRQLCARSPLAAPGAVQPRQAGRPDGSGVAETIADWAATSGTVGLRLLLNRGEATRRLPIPASTGC